MEDYKSNPKMTKYLKDHQMGWDVTDFGKDNFNNQGITLFCIRNGIQSNVNDKPYAEKLLFMQESQEIPFHSHKIKLEDIINRGGGDLAIEFLEIDNKDQQLLKKITVLVDGEKIELDPHEPLILKKGQSVTVERNIFHRFYSVKGSGMVMAGPGHNDPEQVANAWFMVTVMLPVFSLSTGGYYGFNAADSSKEAKVVASVMY